MLNNKKTLFLLVLLIIFLITGCQQAEEVSDLLKQLNQAKAMISELDSKKSELEAELKQAKSKINELEEERLNLLKPKPPKS